MREAKPIGRPREFDADTALAAIMNVFWTKGFEGASMSDLVGATGLKKGSLYGAFGDKRAMYQKALELYDRVWIDLAVRDLRGAGPALDRIEQFLLSAIGKASAQGNARGCFVCNAAIDQVPVDAAAGEQVQRSLGRLERALAAVVAELGDSDGATRQARHLMTVYFGLRVLAKARVAPETLEDSIASALAVLRAPRR